MTGRRHRVQHSATPQQHSTVDAGSEDESDHPQPHVSGADQPSDGTDRRLGTASTTSTTAPGRPPRHPQPQAGGSGGTTAVRPAPGKRPLDRDSSSEEGSRDGGGGPGDDGARKRHAAPSSQRGPPPPDAPTPPSCSSQRDRSPSPLPLHYQHGASTTGGLQATSATARLREAALCGLLWHSQCQALHDARPAQPTREDGGVRQSSREPSPSNESAQAGNDGSIVLRPPHPPKVPTSFTSPQHYVSVFEPLLHEEARGGVVNSWEDARQQQGGRGWQVSITHVSQRPGGWFTASLVAAGASRGAGGGSGRGRGRGRRHSTSSAQESEGTGGDESDSDSGGSGGMSAPARGSHDETVRNDNVLILMRWGNSVSSKNRGSQGQGKPVHKSSSTTSVAAAPQEGGGEESASAPSIPGVTGCQYHDRDGGEEGSGGKTHVLHTLACIVKRGNLGNRSEALHVEAHPSCPYHDTHDWEAPCMKAMREALDQPHGWTVVPVGPLITYERECESLARVGDGSEGALGPLLPMMLDPGTAARRARGQLARIWPSDFTSGELMRSFGEWLAVTYDLPQRTAIEICSSHLATEHQLRTAATPVLPFSLIQGPPGTGKTHTVKGILNVWHVIQYRRYHDAWRQEAAVALGDLQRSAVYDRVTRGLDLLSELRLPLGVHRPRVLVCAPSNAATDELCERILTEGFRDLSGSVVFPNIARVGSQDAAAMRRMAEAVRKDVWIEARVNYYLSLTHTMFAQEFHRAEALRERAVAQISQLLGRLDAYAARGQEGLLELAGLLVDLQTERARAVLEQAKLNTVAPRFIPHSHTNERKMREALEVLLMDAAELVFATLSSTGRRVFSRLSRPFDAVLIDEACQAAEVSALQPLVYGTNKVVLVGDPKQLPATLFSRAAKELALERSLFERMNNAGVPVVLLSVQYRMHPEIRSFPSAYFYDNQLQDAAQVRNMPPAPFHFSRLLKPYVLFDVAGGAEGTGAGGKSRCNEAEARVALALYHEMRCEMEVAWDRWRKDRSLPQPPRVEVGIITPYRSQRDLLRERALGPEVFDLVRIETVDSFQGKQVDVVILSCVRAGGDAGGGGGGIGFLSDTRRLNVAITRAKRSLWILGHLPSLRQHPVWAALANDAARRGTLVGNVDSAEPLLFPRFSAMQQRLDGMFGGKHPASAMQPPPPQLPALAAPHQSRAAPWVIDYGDIDGPPPAASPSLVQQPPPPQAPAPASFYPALPPAQPTHHFPPMDPRLSGGGGPMSMQVYSSSSHVQQPPGSTGEVPRDPRMMASRPPSLVAGSGPPIPSQGQGGASGAVGGMLPGVQGVGYPQPPLQPHLPGLVPSGPVPVPGGAQAGAPALQQQQQLHTPPYSAHGMSGPAAYALR